MCLEYTNVGLSLKYDEVSRSSLCHMNLGYVLGLQAMITKLNNYPDLIYLVMDQVLKINVKLLKKTRLSNLITLKQVKSNTNYNIQCRPRPIDEMYESLFDMIF